MPASQDVDFVIGFFTELSKALVVQRSIGQSAVQTVISEVLDVFFPSWFRLVGHPLDQIIQSVYYFNVNLSDFRVGAIEFLGYLNHRSEKIRR